MEATWGTSAMARSGIPSDASDVLMVDEMRRLRLELATRSLTSVDLPAPETDEPDLFAGRMERFKSSNTCKPSG